LQLVVLTLKRIFTFGICSKKVEETLLCLRFPLAPASTLLGVGDFGSVISMFAWS
jgi:hypothetical protein